MTSTKILSVGNGELRKKEMRRGPGQIIVLALYFIVENNSNVAFDLWIKLDKAIVKVCCQKNRASLH